MLVGSVCPFTVWLPLLVSSLPSGEVQNVTSSPGFLPKSSRTRAAPLPSAKFTVNGTSRVSCRPFLMPFRVFK